MKWAILADGALQYHGLHNPIINGDGSVTVTSDPALLKERGYMPVVTVEPDPPEGYAAAGYEWTVEDGAIVQRWSYQPAEPEEPSQSERIEALELAMLELLEVINNG